MEPATLSLPHPLSDSVSPLMGQRALLKQWLARLDDCGSTAPYHVAARVRADYLDRLGRVLDGLRAHGDELREQLDALERELSAAEAEHTTAMDTLEETRLRHLAGELDEEHWSGQAESLQEAVARADTERARIQAEAEPLRGLLAELEVPTAQPSAEMSFPGHAPGEPSPQSAVPLRPDNSALPLGGEAPRLSADAVFAEWGSDGADEEDEENLPWLELLDEAPEDESAPAEFDALSFLAGIEDAEPTQAAPAEEDGDLAFLQELDRAIAMSATRERPSKAGSTTERLECSACGAENNPASWYCESCGGELA